MSTSINTATMSTVSTLITVLMNTSLSKLLHNNKDAPFIFQKVGWILLASRLLPGLEGVTEISSKNANKGFAVITNYVRDFLGTNIKDGNADGKSDATFRSANKTFITSAKYREGEDVSIAKDMDALNTLRATRPEFADAASVVFVRDRDAWIAAHKRASSKNLYTIDYAHVYDVKMFEDAILELRKIIAKYNGSINDFAVKYLPYMKVQMKLKFHQHLAQIMYKSPIFLFAMKCRAGKTVSAAFNIISQGYKTVMYITPVPSETKNPAIDTFRRYIEFDDYDIINLESGATIPSPITKPIIFVTSKQYLDRHHNDDTLKAVHFDAVYQDEIHWAGLTDKNSQMRRSIIRDDTSLILMTGTGERVRIELGLDDTHIVHWNLEEEAACKRGDILHLKNVYGKENVAAALVKTFGEHDDYAPLLKTMYAEMPQLRQLIYKLKPEFLKNFAEFTDKEQYSFDMQELFRMKDGELLYRDRVLKLLKSYLGSDDGSVHNSIMDQIRGLGTRTGQYGPKYYPGGGGATQLWFLPEQVAGGSLDSLSKLLKTLIDEHFPEYAAVVVNSSAKLDTREGMEKFVAEQEKLANKKQGLILLLGKMMAMGVSLPRADIVCMFNNLRKIDLYTQMSMRCLTQDVGKTTGFVIDFNQKRVLEMSMALVPRCEGTGGEIIDRMTKVIAFGANSFETKDVTEIVAHFNNIWTTQAFDKVKVLGARLNNYVGSLTVTAEEQKEIVKSSWVRTATSELREHQSILDASEKVDDAKSVASSDSESKGAKKEEPETLEDVIPNFSYEVLTTIPPFVAFLTYDRKREEFIGDLLTRIRDDERLNDIFREQCGSWWKGTKKLNFIDLLINIFGRCDSKASRGISVIMSALKSEMESLIDDMHATLDFLNSILAPKQSEKKEFGEVFTPDWFADGKMLAAYPASTWTDPDGKFYDPAAGSGVFGVCIYYRLMDGLQSVFPNEAERKKHILTKMLFMSELGAKNVGILKHIFGGSANIYHGDSLKFDAEKHWGFDMKDVHVIGNPPYNKERTRSGASPFYNEFIEKYIDNCRTLSFVVPSRWFAGGKGLDTFRKMMLSRRDIRFINHIDDASSVFGSNVSIKGGINYFMVDRDYEGDCNYNGVMTDLSTLDILVDSRFNSLIGRMVTNPSITTIYKPSGEYKVRTNGKLNGKSVLCDDTSLTKCYVSQKNGFLKYIDPSIVTNPSPSWKVITPRAAHGAGSGFGSKFVGGPSDIYTDSYISFNVASETEAAHLISYLNCKLPNKLLSLRKCSQDIAGDTCKWIPLPPLDRIWDNDAVNKYYNITKEEIALLS
jgi:Eco57I restriction-modification methylase